MLRFPIYNSSLHRHMLTSLYSLPQKFPVLGLLQAIICAQDTSINFLRNRV
ncbi:hypothetical protein FIU97_12570 [Roseivivax sp. THAF40]|nr:hypothetical protein FIU97_12570 [Roseivivax sp. THAF40]